MTSYAVTNAPMASGIEQHVPVWMKIDWSPEIQHLIFKSWGVYYSNRRRGNTAMTNFQKALAIVDDDYLTLYRYSQVMREAANIKQALKDTRRAAEIATLQNKLNSPINLQICDAVFELNDFESCKRELHDNIRAFSGAKSSDFKNRLIVVDDVIKDVTGKAMSIFFMKNQKLVYEANKHYKASLIKDTRPEWKVLRDQNKCDVVSIHEIEEELLSPLEIARRSRVFNVIHQNYLNDSWVDVLFMKALRTNPSLQLEQCKRSVDKLKTLSNDDYDVVRQFIKMLQCRSPLYYTRSLKFPNKQLLKKSREALLFRIQHQTHRHMIADLREIRRLRQAKNVKQLTGFIEMRMSQYYVIKTNRVMCWKFEFINEVYNTLALALCENYRLGNRVPTLQNLLLLPVDKVKDIKPFKFGDRMTYMDGDNHDPVAHHARKLIIHLEKRLLFAKYSIEKCYLLHRIASVHLSQLHYDECCFNARKAIKETSNCNSFIWKFLSSMEIVKANSMQYKVEKTHDALEQVFPIAKKLNNPKLVRFIDVCISLNMELAVKKQTMLSKRRSSRTSGISSSHASII